MGRILAAPTELSGCELWLDAMDSASVIRDGAGLVSQWSDKSGKAKHAAQATPANQPTYSATAFGGMPCINWGNGEVAARRLVTPDVSYGPFTIFLVASAIVATTGYPYVHNIYSGGAEAEYFIHGGVAGRPQISLARGSVTSNRNFDDFSDGKRHIVTRYFGGLNSNNSLRFDGLQAQVTNGTVANNPGVGLCTGPIYVGNANLAVAPHKGVTAEFIIFNRMLSEGEMVLVEQYLAKKWAIAPARLIASPLELPDCKLWVDAAQTTLISGAVSQWSDLSGSNNHLTQATAGARPVVGVGQNGLPCVNFDGTDDILNVTVSIPQPQSVFVVGKFGGSGTGTMLCGGGNQMRFWRVDASAMNVAGASANTLALPASTPDVWHVHGFQLNGVASSYVQDNAVRVRGNAGVATATGVGVGGLTGFGAPQYALCSVAEAIVFNRALADGERAQVDAYLRRKYAL
jgi:hypothetical protein